MDAAEPGTLGTASVNTDSAVKAGFWIRVGASLIDFVILAIAGTIIQKIFGSGVGGVLSLLVDLGYLVYFWTTTGQTIGHKALNLKVIKEDGSKLSVTDGILRYVGEIISSIPICIGFMWVGWDSKKQGWHDKIAHTYVIRV